MRFWCILFSLHVPWSCDHFLHTLYFLTYIYIYIYIYMYIYEDVCFSSPLSHMCYFFSIFIHMFLLVYNLSMFHTWSLDESYLSVSVKTGCKSTMPWSLFLQSFSRVHVQVIDLRTFVYCGIVVLDFSHNWFCWFCHGLPKGEILRFIYILCNWLIFWQNRSKMGLVLQESCCLSKVLKTWRLIEETSEKKLFIKSWWIAWQIHAIKT